MKLNEQQIELFKQQRIGKTLTAAEDLEHLLLKKSLRMHNRNWKICNLFIQKKLKFGQVV